MGLVFGICPHSHSFFETAKTIFEPPEFTAGCFYQKHESISVIQGAVLGGGFGVLTASSDNGTIRLGIMAGSVYGDTLFWGLGMYPQRFRIIADNKTDVLGQQKKEKAQ